MESPPATQALEALLRGNPLLWRGRDAGPRRGHGIPTGFAALDAALPLGGWPAGGLVEILASRRGIGELRLLLPAMAHLARQGRRVIWIAPPFRVHAPALEQGGMDPGQIRILGPRLGDTDALWGMEKVLRAGACGMALYWPRRIDARAMRRLQLAAESGNTLGVVYGRERGGASPAALRLQLTPAPGGLHLTVVKARGASRYPVLHIAL